MTLKNSSGVLQCTRIVYRRCNTKARSAIHKARSAIHRQRRFSAAGFIPRTDAVGNMVSHKFDLELKQSLSEFGNELKQLVYLVISALAVSLCKIVYYRLSHMQHASLLNRPIDERVCCLYLENFCVCLVGSREPW